MFNTLGTKPSSLSQRIVEEIKRALMTGQLKPGDRLPPERELCAMLGVSRTSLREALKVLAGGGLVSIQHGQGVFITQADPEAVLDRLSGLLLTSHGTVADLFEIRKLLETQAAAWAAQRASDDEIQALDRLLAECRRRADAGELDTEGYEAYDQRFHFLLAEATRNAVLVRIMNHLIDLLAEGRRFSLKVPGRPRRSLDDHLAILDAVRRRDADGARAAMLAHLEAVEKSIRPAPATPSDRQR